MTNGVIIVGSLHYDVIVEAPHRPRKGETVTGYAWYPKFGGKGGNQALAAAAAGANTRFVGAVGDDGFADTMLKTLGANGVQSNHVATIRGCGTGMSVAIIDAEGDYGAVIVSGANLHIDPAQFMDGAMWRDSKVLILQNEIPEDVNIAAARAARQNGVRVCLNAAPYRVMSPDLLQNVDILVVNAVEAEDMGAAPVTDLASAGQAAMTLCDRVATVIVTAGGHGVAWATQGMQAVERPAISVEVISTHGAGDVFIGTLCRALAEGADLATGLTQANTAAALHISTPRTTS